jgi:thioredoxin-like negative regulator of GroEL
MSMREDTRPLLLFFVNERSGPARRMESVVAHLARVERDRLRVRRVDVDARPDLAERFCVVDVPTLALVKDRRIVARRDGRVSQPKIVGMLEPHLDPRETAAVQTG